MPAIKQKVVDRGSECGSTLSGRSWCVSELNESLLIMRLCTRSAASMSRLKIGSTQMTHVAYIIFGLT
jgi:hypothetical protein